MKTKNKYSILKWIYSVLILLLIIGCDEDDDIFPASANATQSITELLESESNLSTLTNTLKQLGLNETLANETTFTVFAPTNTAFEAIDTSVLDEENLRNLVLNHVWSTTTADLSENLITGYRNSMAIGPDGNNLSFYVNTTSENLVFNGVANPLANKFDLGATNGVVHVIDEVLALPDVIDLVAANPEYSLLVNAIEQAKLIEALKGNGPFTLLAPNNSAFEVALNQLEQVFGWKGIEEIPIDILTEILTYHVSDQGNLIASAIDGQTIETLEGNTFSVSGTTVTDGSNTNATINLVDVQAINGVIHGVDKVVLPAPVFQKILSVTLDLPTRLRDRGYNTFADVIELVDLTDFAKTTELTALVPTDEAFEVFLSQIENFESLSDFDTDEEIEALKQLINYHLIEEVKMSNQFESGAIETRLNESLIVEVADKISLVPTRENAPKVNFSITDIGASNGVIHQIDNVLVPESLAVALGYPNPVVGGAPVFGFEIFDDALAEGMWAGAWAITEFDNTDPVRSGSFSVKATFPGGDEGFQVGGANFNVTDFTFVNASIYSETGTTVGFVLNEQWGNQFNVDIPAGEWTEVAVPVSAVANGTIAFEQLVIRGAAGIANDVIFIDEIGFDVTFVSSVPALDFDFYKDALAEGMWAGAWAVTDFNNTSPVREGTLSVKATFPGGDEGFQIGGATLNVTDFSFINASIYSETGTTVGFVLNEQWGNQFNVAIPAGEWLEISVPIGSVANGTIAFEQLVIRGAAGIPNDEIFIDNIGLTK